MKIILPVDFSEKDAQMAAFIGQQFAAPVELHLFHLMQYPILPSAFSDAGGALAEVYVQLKAQAESQLADLISKFQSDKIVVKSTLIQEPGLPIGKALNQYAQDQGADLVMLNSRHRKGLDLLFEGSNLLSIVRSCHVPMLVLSASPQPIHRIGFATDFSEASGLALGHVKAISKALNAGLVCFRVITSDDFCDQRTFAQERIQFVNAQGLGDIPEIVAYNAWDLEEGILQAGEDLLADTLALSTHARKGLSRIFNGSVTERIIRSTTAPLIVINQQA